MDIEAYFTSTPLVRPLGLVAKFGVLWRAPLRDNVLKALVAVIGAFFASYVYMCAKSTALGTAGYQFGDFYALWTSAVVAHDGQPLLNYDADALHDRQVQLGMNPHGYNPFPYPPTLLVFLSPLGGLTLPIAYMFFIVPSFAAYLWAMTGGRIRDWRWGLGAFVAPATGITVISGQSGFLSAALMIGGLRLVGARPALAGVLLGLLAYKPQLGMLLPFALFASAQWRAIASAIFTVVISIIGSSLILGSQAWPTWLHGIADYTARFPPVLELMPTVYANLLLVHTSSALALAAQTAVTLAIVASVWRACQSGIDERSIGLILIGTFLATPHAFNYDMPMTIAALTAYAAARYDADGSINVAEVIVLIAGFLLPFLVLALRHSGAPYSWAVLAIVFLMIMRPWGAVRRETKMASAHPVQ